MIFYFVVGFGVLAVREFEPTLPILPVSTNTLVWLLSLLYPALALSYSMARIRVRKNEIIEMCRRDRLWNVYFPAAADPEIDFERYVLKRVGEYYGVLELAGFSFACGTASFVVLLIILYPGATTPADSGAPEIAAHAKAIMLQLPPEEGWRALVGLSFLGAYCGGLLCILKRYRAFDLRPTAFLQTLVGLVAGTAVGSIVSLLYPKVEVGVLGFIIGFVAAINTEFLSELLRKKFAGLTGHAPAPEIETDLDKIVRNSDAIEGLRKISINAVRGLANTDPIDSTSTLPRNSPSSCQ